MADYCTVENILTVNPILPRTGTSGFTSTMTDTISRHIVRASGVIDGYCARRFSLPFTSTSIPPMIRTICEDITSYYTYRSYFTQDNANRSEYYDQYEKAMLDLEKIRDGAIDLVDTSGTLVPVNTADTQSLLDSTTKDYHSFFDVDDSLNWKFDDDLLNAVSDGRE